MVQIVLPSLYHNAKWACDSLSQEPRASPPARYRRDTIAAETLAEVERGAWQHWRRRKADIQGANERTSNELVLKSSCLIA